ncbi:hypothetical protein PIB30_074782 [Stylosanthes scabra]|uniref:Uncharacterized protein n=1 Tax=Stylosanthes scabra TaxID=79078 RepID=A0ABU6VRM4_9FABA|nr:hypothetical protein [Stylosanthes scabra]
MMEQQQARDAVKGPRPPKACTCRVFEKRWTVWRQSADVESMPFSTLVRLQATLIACSLGALSSRGNCLIASSSCG